MTSPHLETELTPVTLLTGFLGSGKTTVLNQLVRQPTLARTLRKRSSRQRWPIVSC
ncbi:GTP-binding protein [Halochromatium glycolicum]|uniref:GTP-binding protein n=1 Tax=Halochromatium glycolicum TaxID=85075 RepID=UPI001F5B1ACD|nr:GTP-binding protein [Halochromatium glycolicum]